LIVAVHLSKNQRFEEAQRWFHRIFDPTCTDTSIAPPQRFWRFLRFRQETTPEFIAELLEELQSPETPRSSADSRRVSRPGAIIHFSRTLSPRGRYLAYQLNVLMKYLDNLLAWAISCSVRTRSRPLTKRRRSTFLRRTSSAEAAKDSAAPQDGPKSFAQLKKVGIDAFGNALVETRERVSFQRIVVGRRRRVQQRRRGRVRHRPFAVLRDPAERQAAQLLERGHGRLYKIRHCMNIEGVVRQLPLFDPPIDRAHWSRRRRLASTSPASSTT